MCVYVCDDMVGCIREAGGGSQRERSVRTYASRRKGQDYIVRLGGKNRPPPFAWLLLLLLLPLLDAKLNIRLQGRGGPSYVQPPPLPSFFQSG